MSGVIQTIFLNTIVCKKKIVEILVIITKLKDFNVFSFKFTLFSTCPSIAPGCLLN